jgi:hypothetical protein
MPFTVMTVKRFDARTDTDTPKPDEYSTGRTTHGQPARLASQPHKFNHASLSRGHMALAIASPLT